MAASLYQEILGAPDVPFLSTFMVDGRTQSAKRMEPAAALVDARQQVAKAPSGKVSMLDGHVKLFADGAMRAQSVLDRGVSLSFRSDRKPVRDQLWPR